MTSRDRLFSILLTALVLLFCMTAVVDPPAVQAQTVQVLSADPPSATQGVQNLNVLIKGKGFKRGAIAKFLVTGTTDTGGVHVKSTTFVSSTDLIANIDVADTAILSLYDIEVMLSDGRGGKGTELFTVNKKTETSCTLPPPVPEGGYCISGTPGVAGCLDSSFGAGTGRVLGPRNVYFTSITMQSIGVEQRIVALGPGVNSTDPCTPAMQAIVGYRSDGTIDTAFGSSGFVRDIPLEFAAIVGATQIAVQPDNKLVVVGRATVQVSSGKKTVTVKVPAVARYNPNGTLDTTFGRAGLATVPNGTSAGHLLAVTLQSDGKIVATGAYGYNLFNLAVVRLNPNGTLDTSFNGTGRFIFSANRSEANAIVIQRIGAEERIVVAGHMIRTYAYWTGAVVRLTSAGVLDNTFGANGLVEAVHPPLPSGGYNGGDFQALAVDSNNHILAGGDMFLYGMQLARYDEFGNLDPTFGEGGYFLPPVGTSDGHPDGIVIQPDGFILTVGTSYQDTTRSRPLMTLRRFTPDGAIDLSFGDAGWVLETFLNDGNASGYAFTLQGDNKVIVAGIGPYAMSEGVGYFGAALARFWLH